MRTFSSKLPNLLYLTNAFLAKLKISWAKYYKSDGDLTMMSCFMISWKFDLSLILVHFRKTRLDTNYDQQKNELHIRNCHMTVMTDIEDFLWNNQNWNNYILQRRTINGMQQNTRENQDYYSPLWLFLVLFNDKIIGIISYFS